MASAARDRLARTLRGDTQSAFCTEVAAGMDALTLEVEDFGQAKFPVTPAKARKLIGLGRPARFGRGEETLTDAGIRDTWEIPKGLVHATWDPATLRDVLATVRENLGLPNASVLTADLHSLLVYEPGQFFVAHQDSEKSDDMIGTLVVTLPSSYTGGELMIGQNEEWRAYRGSKSGLSLVAFYADCQHEVLRVKSGYRITLTYNLLLSGDTSRPEGDDGTAAELTDLVREHFATPVSRYYGETATEPPNRLVYLLDHEYTPRGLKWTRLKGADARRAGLLREAAEAAGCEAILALADVRTTHSAFEEGYDDYGYGRGWDDEYDGDEDEDEDDGDDGNYEIQELIDSEVSLTHWTGPDGTRLEETSLFIRDSEVCASTSTGDLEPYESQYEGYMGNWGNTLDRWYHRGAVVMWPRAQAFANRAETSPGWAFDEIVAMASSGDVAGARAAAATLAPFWSGGQRRSAEEAGTTSGLFGKALGAADSVAEAETAAMLLSPFRIENLTGHYADTFGKAAVRYGQKWTGELLRTWFGGDQLTWAYDTGERRRQWVAEWLPGLCAKLHVLGGTGMVAAQRLLGLSWDRIREDIDSGLAAASPSRQAELLGGLGKPLTAVVTAAAAIDAATTLSDISRYMEKQGGPVATLEIAALRAAAELPRDAMAEASVASFRDLAADCAALLRARLAIPSRQAGDWSIRLPAGGCQCDLCGVLRTFLESRDRQVCEWRLAKGGRQHIHSRIDGAELPVTHVTRRQGSPYTLVLRKTDALFTHEQQSRASDQADLDWLATEWNLSA